MRTLRAHDDTSTALPGLTDSSAYHVLAEGLRGDNPLRWLDDVRWMREAVESMMIRTIHDARGAGATWEEIGHGLGISKQAASQLHKRAARS